MKFKINLATRFYIDFKKVNACILLTSIILIIWIISSIYSFTANFTELRKFSQFKSSLDTKSGKDQVSDSDYNKMLAEVKNVNTILTRRAVNWLALFSNLEILVPEGVSLKRIEPDLKGENLKIIGSARNFANIRKFMETLEASKTFTEIYLVDHSIVNYGINQKGINFSVTCKANI